MKPPFPYIGGKTRVAANVWKALGQPAHYIEPFFGSGAVLLARPHWNPTLTETVNDKDGFVCNVWRSIRFSPDETAEWCDWPVNHADLMARRLELIRNEEHLLENLVSDPRWHDPVLAGYWIWALCCWIGDMQGLLSTRDKQTSVCGGRPHLDDSGVGVQRRDVSPRKWLRKLAKRLRRVRVVCGEWSRVCGGDWQDRWPSVGVFFDPPYGVEDRDTGLYHQDSTTVADAVRQWCLERGGRDRYRIVLAGYEEHEELLAHGWTKEMWKSSGGFGNTRRRGNEDGQGMKNRSREVLYLSPYCNRQTTLF